MPSITHGFAAPNNPRSVVVDAAEKHRRGEYARASDQMAVANEMAMRLADRA